VLGVEKTVFESVEYDQEQDLLVARVRPTRRRRGVVAVCACGLVLAMRRRWPASLAGVPGGRWTYGVFDHHQGQRRCDGADRPVR
jgi:hypothetical protein